MATPEGIEKARGSHWSLQPVQAPDLPQVKDAAWGMQPIDRFILAKLEAAGMTPSAVADRRTLLRRATFDLTGLPPTIAEVEAFENDNSPDAFAQVVDRLLASPQYGERWGRHWLDVARYADTKGYVFTEERRYPYSYTYRDYVIDAFNADLPFDRFIVEQLAADLLPPGDDKSHLAAMGFLTLGRRFSNNNNDIIDDRIDVVTRGLMGLTVTCARCHDHKYDPIPQEDYYSLYGVFASSIEPKDLPLIAPPEQTAAYLEFEKGLAEREAEVNAYIDRQHVALLTDIRNRAADYLAEASRQKPEDRGRRRGNQSIGANELRPAVVDRWHDYLERTAKQHHPVFGPWHQLAVLKEGIADGAPKVIESLNDAADAPTRVNPLVKKALVEAQPKSMADVAKAYGELLGRVNTEWVALLAESGKPSTTTVGTAATPTALPDPAAEEVRQVLYADSGPASISRDDVQRIFDRKTRDELRKLQRKVEEYKVNSPNAPPRAMVLNDAERPTEPRVFQRGNPGRPGKQVPRRFLQAVSLKESGPFKQGSGRLELAHAIASPSNPLTARVIVNRVWQHHFGFGLVRTPSDFGFRGESPTHPELLDYLAAAFMADGWSLKKLHRRMLLTNVYRQQSIDRPECALQDPENRLLWRMNPQRLEFEPMRDSILAVAGKLDPTVGGRPVDLFSKPFTTRRAVYGFIDRQDLPGTFRVFDFASPDVSTPMRPQTTIPQQALFGMNSPFVVEQAKSLAARKELSGESDSTGRVRALYRLVYAREPDSVELAAGVRFLDDPIGAEPVLSGAWQYGWGAYDEQTKRVATFTQFPHFEEGRWRGGPQLPDPTIGWAFLTAQGGHTGKDLEHCAIRRWRAPAAGNISIAGVLDHPAEQGDGVRGRIVSSRAGELGVWTVHHGKADTKLDRLEVEAGETIDFVVDCLTNQSHDSFQWPPVIVFSEKGRRGMEGRKQFIAPADFHGPQPPPLSPLEQYAQALLLANEFVFVD
jgi:hypothetical protein